MVEYSAVYLSTSPSLMDSSSVDILLRAVRQNTDMERKTLRCF